jgi:hypothetical protein
VADPGDDVGPADDRELRLLGIQTLRELLVRAAARRPLVMWIDDLHWIDDDTAEALAVITCVPNTMVIYSYRDGEDPGLAAARGPSGSGAVRVHDLDIAVDALDADDLEVVVRAIVPDAAPGTCRALAAAADGSPVFARVLGLHRTWATEPPDLSSPAALWNQLIDALPAAQRALFDVIAVAPGPVAAAVARSAASVEHASPELRALEQLGIISRAGDRGHVDLIERRVLEARLQMQPVDDLLRADLGRLVLLRDHPLAPEPAVEPLAERDDLGGFHHARALRVLDALHVLLERILRCALRVAMLGRGPSNAHLLPIRLAYDLTIAPSTILASEHRHSQAFRVDAALHGSNHDTSVGRWKRSLLPNRRHGIVPRPA